jgi:hypothetical protein
MGVSQSTVKTSQLTVINDIVPSYNSGAIFGTKARLFAIRNARKTGKSPPSSLSSSQSLGGNIVTTVALDPNAMGMLSAGNDRLNRIKTTMDNMQKGFHQQFIFKSFLRLGDKDLARKYILDLQHEKVCVKDEVQLVAATLFPPTDSPDLQPQEPRVEEAPRLEAPRLDTPRRDAEDTPVKPEMEMDESFTFDATQEASVVTKEATPIEPKRKSF